ncbi:abl interactor 1-like isoform X5 [Gadus macrocephalus]|uniref:abl interactor 1-like isoform X5 n=1 Tax=Gadus macrocephalus TaxID=80720 RepID=UPI0028CB1A3F|nr:abl interactor 1-like isoform X5 [Gadus macrocephalus]
MKKEETSITFPLIPLFCGSRVRCPVMKEQKLKQEVCSIQQEAPSARQALLDNFTNLLKVAEYCHTNYLQSGVSSKKALEETKSFASQSLASVVYQISTLANSLLALLDAQTNLIGHMESSINLIGQTVEMHREKVARREIGISTVMKRVPRGAEMTPADPAVHRPTEYHRRPIDYSVLDSVGHQYTIPGKQHSGMIRKAGSSIRSFKAPGQVICPLPPSLGFFHNSEESHASTAPHLPLSLSEGEGSPPRHTLTTFRPIIPGASSPAPSSPVGRQLAVKVISLLPLTSILLQDYGCLFRII